MEENLVKKIIFFSFESAMFNFIDILLKETSEERGTEACLEKDLATNLGANRTSCS